MGLVAAFFTLGFLSLTGRYMNRALLGVEVALGMFGFYVILTYAALTVAIVGFRPRYSTVRYMGGTGLGLGAVGVLLAILLFTSDGSAGILMLIVTLFLLGLSVTIYAVGRAFDDDYEASDEEVRESAKDEQRQAVATSETQSRETVEPEPVKESESREASEPVATDEPEGVRDPEPTEVETESTESETDDGIDWVRGGQIFVGATLFIVGAVITIQSPLGVPIFIAGLALIPRVRSWSMEKLA